MKRNEKSLLCRMDIGGILVLRDVGVVVRVTVGVGGAVAETGVLEGVFGCGIVRKNDRFRTVNGDAEEVLGVGEEFAEGGGAESFAAVCRGDEIFRDEEASFVGEVEADSGEGGVMSGDDFAPAVFARAAFAIGEEPMDVGSPAVVDARHADGGGVQPGFDECVGGGVEVCPFKLH